MASEPAAFAHPVKFGDDLELDPRAYELRRAGRPLKLERIPMDLLLLLVESRGQLVTREQIIERIWGRDVFLDADTSINSAIRKIRQVLKDDPEQPKFIQTVTGRGYRFIGSVTDVVPLTLAPPTQAPVGPIQGLQSGDLASPAGDLASPAGDLASPAETITQVRELAVRFHGRAAQAAAAAVVLLLFLGAIVYWNNQRRSLLRPQFKTIAVLPLQNYSGDPQQEYFVDGMTDSVIADLGKIKDLRVISRTSVTPYKNSRKSMREIASDLHADAVIEGSVTRSAAHHRSIDRRGQGSASVV
jgi:DNA-binding winged helix-turn-helix (wHTH) protein